MKGILHKTTQGWIVIYDEVVGENIVKKNQNALPLVDNGRLNGLALYDSNEGLEVDFEIFIDFDNNGPEHFPKFARIITSEEDKMVTKCYCGHTSYCDCGPLPEEDELKDWDVTLNDGLDNEPYISDDFQIGPDGAYEHNEDVKSTMVFKGDAKWHRSAYIKLEDNKVIFDCSNEEYGPIVFDIELLKDALNKHKQMTPKEKAKELVDTYSFAISLTTDGGKAAATIAVDEIITQYNFMTPNVAAKSYWIEVKQEIEKL